LSAMVKFFINLYRVLVLLDPGGRDLAAEGLSNKCLTAIESLTWQSPMVRRAAVEELTIVAEYPSAKDVAAAIDALKNHVINPPYAGQPFDDDQSQDVLDAFEFLHRFAQTATPTISLKLLSFKNADWRFLMYRTWISAPQISPPLA